MNNQDIISRSALIADIEESVVFTVKGDSSSAEMRGANKIIDRIKAAPAVDAVEVVRCQNCRKCEEMGGALYCHHWSRNTDTDGYCHEGY